MTELLATCWTHAGTAYPVPGHNVSPLSFRARAEAAATAGFTGIGLDLVDLRASAKTTDLRELKALFDELGLVHVELELLTGWWTSGQSRVESDADRRDLFHVAEALGAHHVKICGQLAFDDGVELEAFDLERVAPLLHDLAVEAAGIGTRLALEPMPLTNVVTVAQGRELIEAADHPALGLCVDVWHVERGGTPLADVRALPADKIVAVEIDDAPVTRVGSFFEDTIFNRRLPGDGDFDLPGFVDAIRATGYAGPWGVEILSDTQRLRPMPQAVREAFDSSKLALGEWPPNSPSDDAADQTAAVSMRSAA